MSDTAATEPVQDTIAKVNDEIAVGQDLEFQRRWWRFERAVWMVFTAIVILDLLGFLGRGHFAKARLHAQDGSMEVRYERIERYSAPSILMVQFGPNAIREGKVQLWASESLVKALGNQRVVPQPAASVVSQGGILYTFPAAGVSGSVEFALEPRSVGMQALQLHVPGFQELLMKIFVMP